ncbi:hypothetical protein BJV85_002832 [Clostridium acetobutylicum]|nr:MULTISPECIES: hypothetical protein [Clostridium]ADZ20217.1 Conserved hypothetical protein [Clostridium acetobutylicum EA 2018]NOV89987.1 hypothetical protein [Clostridium acetobutylicum]NOW15485.1 hypothetical protein [Clostridium acetobutylicum]NRY57165.1 hypothetical protein [Clostridium acetobutylicum]NSA93909.1 hypothetical protein [Clostridium acetobutylicum]
MNKLERLYEIRKELDKTLRKIELEQVQLKNEITEKRNIGWNKMFDDLYSLKKYSCFIDTGISLYKCGDETLGFEIRDEYICVISWKHINCDGKRIEPRTETYFFTIKKQEPFKTDLLYRNYMKYVIYAIENWNEVKVEIERRLSKRIESEMKKKISNLEKRQNELEKELSLINH